MISKRDMARGALTILVRITPGQTSSLRTLLEEIGGQIADSPHIRFSSLETTHFMRWVILDRDATYAPQLAFESNYDGTLEGHLEELLRVAGKTLDLIYGHCEGYPRPGARTNETISAFLKSHAVKSAALYRGYPGRRLPEIRRNTRMFEHIQSFLKTHHVRLRALTPSEIRQELLGYLDAQNALGTSALSPSQSPNPPLLKRIRSRPLLIYLLLLVAAPVFAPLVLIFLVVLYFHERSDPAAPKMADEVRSELSQQENQTAQNQLTHIVELKPGIFRRCVLRLVLWSIDVLANHYFIDGALGGITSIHSARWVLIDNGRRLLFFSNYDGSWERYLGDFVDLSSTGLTGIWSNTQGFPRTRNLVRGGSTNEDAFKQWARDHQVRTQVWYSAHPKESVRNILNNAAIRDELLRPVCGPLLMRWMQRL